MKQDPRAWYGRIDSFLTSLGFTKGKAKPNLYFKVIQDEPGILLLYVDDLFFYAVEILKKFDMLECKAMATPMDTNLKLLANESLELVDVTQYRQIIGSLMYPTNT